MDKTMETILIVIIAVFVLYTAMIDPVASLLVAVLAVAAYMVYQKLFGKPEKAEPVRRVVSKRKTAKKTTKRRK